MELNIVILLLLVGIHQGKAETNHTHIGKGVLISELKPILIVKGELLLSVPLRDFKLNQLVSHLDKTLANSSFNNWEGLGTYTSCSKVVGDWQRFRTAKAGKIRGKRGLLDLGGEILQGLFGVSTDKDLRALEKKIGRRLALHTVELRKVARLNELQKEMYKTIVHGLKALQNETEHQFKILGRLLIDEEVASWCAIYNTLKIDLELGHLNRHFLDTQDLREILREYQDKWGLRAMSPNNMIEFEKAVNTKVIRLPEGGRTALLSIPFFEKESYLAYRFRSFPMRVEGTDKKMALKLDNEVLVISKNKQKFNTVNRAYMEQCTRVFQGAAICPNLIFFVVEHSGIDQCKLNVITQNNYSYCDFNNYNLNKVEAQEVDDKLYLSANPNEVVTVGCHGKTLVKRLTGAGVGVFPITCNVHSLHLEYTPRRHKGIDMSGYGGDITIPDLQIQFSADIKFAEKRKLKETRILISELNTMGKNDLEFGNLGEGKYPLWGLLLMTLIIGCLLVVLVGVMMFCWRKRKLDIQQLKIQEGKVGYGRVRKSSLVSLTGARPITERIDTSTNNSQKEGEGCDPIQQETFRLTVQVPTSVAACQ